MYGNEANSLSNNIGGSRRWLKCAVVVGGGDKQSQLSCAMVHGIPKKKENQFL